ncbi:permease prefix domain 1-containing protein [Bacillus cereus group sp. BfR-BA-01380]|uniref:permease prefix domain 1-containing protein n=1 Tax=Bacillus cereus group sp. BfR-BA-01380 TaxID=2920324 RepID=UPI001F59D548|nr:permease prefix domain 1-containing protein [Bacillus cereus group sp. BfR-BA-01380]
MKKIDVFIDSVYQNVGGNKKEVQELKAEMKGHLIEAVHELKAEGKSEQEAIEIAINRFGGEKEMHATIRQLFQAQKTFAKWVLYLAITFLVLSSTVFGLIKATDKKISRENSIVATKTLEILGNKDEISEDMKNEINKLVNRTDLISKVQIYNINDVKKEAENFTSIFDYKGEVKPNYQHVKTTWAPKWVPADYLSYGIGEDKWHVNIETKDIRNFMTLLLFVGIAVYAVLFTIWATINAYHRKRFHIGWIIVFALFNVFGYLAYYFSDKRKTVN